MQKSPFLSIKKTKSTGRRWLISLLILSAIVAGAGFAAIKTGLMASPSQWWAQKDTKVAAGTTGTGAGKDEAVSLSLVDMDIATAGAAELEQTLYVSGNVDAVKTAVVRSKQNGFLTQMTKRAGDSVKAGERLAKVENDELRMRISEREAAVKQTQAALGVAESNRAQQRALADKGFISKAALDTVESNVVAARSSFDAARTQFEIAKSAQADTVLTAPISGVIAKRAAEPGERATNDMAVFTIVDASALEVTVFVAAERAAALKIGQKAKFQLDTTVVEGTLNRIIPSSNTTTRTVETRFALPSGSTVPVGAFVSGSVVLSKNQALIAVPRVAVKTDASGSYVWLVKNNKAMRSRVKLGESQADGALVPVLDGVASGATVLVLRGAEPFDGQAVLMPAQNAAPAAK